MLECQSLLDNFMDIESVEQIESLRRFKRPKSYSDAATESTFLLSNAVLGFPPLPEEPNGDFDQSVLCKICIRLPDGRKIQRNFLKSESVQLLWSFCYSQIDDISERKNKTFKLIQAFPGEYRTLHYGSNTSFDQSGLANSLVSVVTWA